VGIPVAAALVAAFFFWQSTRTLAFTERDTIIIADFANTTGDAVFDDALRQTAACRCSKHYL